MSVCIETSLENIMQSRLKSVWNLHSFYPKIIYIPYKLLLISSMRTVYFALQKAAGATLSLVHETLVLLHNRRISTGQTSLAYFLGSHSACLVTATTVDCDNQSLRWGAWYTESPTSSHQSPRDLFFSKEIIIAGSWLILLRPQTRIRKLGTNNFN